LVQDRSLIEERNMKYFTAIAACLALLPATAAAQQDVNRRAYSFLENHLEIAVVAEAPGVLQVVRGERGRLEVAGRSLDGFSGSALGGHLTRQLRLTAVGAEAVEYLVVVPDHVNVRVHLPDGSSASVAPRAPAASFRWAGAAPLGSAAAPPLQWAADVPSADRRASLDAAAAAAQQELRAPPQPQLLRTTGSGLYVVHSSSRTPAAIDVPDLAAVRTLDLRFEGSEFRIAASRPLAMEPGDAARFVIRAHGEPLDLVVYVPRDTRSFLLSAAGVRIAEATGGRPRALCGNVVIQSPTDFQTWLTFRPQDGQIDCRPVGRL
jgi:hypothetical protein